MTDHYLEDRRQLAQKGIIHNADVMDLARGETSLERQFKGLPWPKR